MAIPVFTIGEHLKEIRAGRTLTLEETAELTGVSKPMLGQIERGQSIPTITTLWKIATGLKVPLSRFLEVPKEDFDVVDVSAEAVKKAVICEDSGRMRAYPLFAYDPVRSVEIFQIDFDPGCRHVSEKHNDGVEEYILVRGGALQLVIGEHEIVLREGQAVRFRADVAHTYCNPFDGLCSVYNMIFYPKHERR